MQIAFPNPSQQRNHLTSKDKPFTSARDTESQALLFLQIRKNFKIT